MDAGYAKVRNLLYVVFVLLAIAVLSNFYVASQISHNSDELANMQLLLQKQMLEEPLKKADEVSARLDSIKTKLDSLNKGASDIDAKMTQAQEQMDAKLKQAQDQMDAKLKQAQDDFVARLRVEVPKMMDDYIKERVPALRKQLPQ